MDVLISASDVRLTEDERVALTQRLAGVGMELSGPNPNYAKEHVIEMLQIEKLILETTILRKFCFREANGAA